MNYKVATLNKISPKGLEKFDDKYEIIDSGRADEASAILVRSQDMLSMEFSPELKAVARAGAGVNNIPLDRCAAQGIVVFNTPGANANAVKELVLAGMLLASRNIPKAVNWASALSPMDDGNGGKVSIAKQVEKGKSQFAGTEIAGKTLSVIGFGAIGRKVGQAAFALGMDIVAYDPFYSEREEDKNYKIVDSIEEAVSYGDFVTLHLPANKDTEKMIDTALISKMKDGAVLLNFSRDKLMNFDDLFEALKTGKIAKYVTDFPTDDLAMFDENYEPLANVKLISDKCIQLPHLGASTEEAEDNCAIMAVNQTRDYLENGNIINSVNFPRLDMGAKGENIRLGLMTRGMQNPVLDLMELMAKLNAQVSKTMSVRREDGIAYTLFELKNLPEEAEEILQELDSIITCNIMK